MRRLVAVVFVASSVLLHARPASAVDAVDRVAGVDRYATAAEASRSTFAAGVPVAYVVTGAGFADALTAGAPAARRGGPVLLVAHSSIPAVTAGELERLRPAEIVVVGGTGAVSDDVVRALERYTPGQVSRVAGTDRYETAARVSAEAFAGSSVVYVADGARFSDALAGVPAAHREGAPMLLVTGSSVPASTASEIRRLGASRAVILGGTASVGAAAESQLRSMVEDVERVAGADRYRTSVLAAQRFGSASTAYLASGATFADALAGGPVAASASAPILLVRANCVPNPVGDELVRLGVQRVVLLGGGAALGRGVERLTTCPYAGAPSRTPTVASRPTAPAFDDDAPDPHLVRVGDSWYVFSTGTTWGNRIGVLTSTSPTPTSGWRTITGEPHGSTALPSIPSWQVPDTQWAPGVFEHRGRWVMFYAARVRSHGHWCISVATAARVTGPYEDGSSGPIVCQTDIGGSIDPQPFVDADGRPWLHWKNNDGSTADVSKVWSAPLDRATGTVVAGTVREVMAKDTERHRWQTTLDNPQMVIAGGRHHLLYSSGDWQDDTYATGYAVCAGPQGPCESGAEPILQTYADVAGPAGGTVEEGSDGRWWLAYHAWNGGVRKLYVAPLELR